MANSFDPYLDWFDIPPGDQPPNHYQLLGLAIFEDAQSKIEDAVAARAQFLHALSMGEHVEDAQRILNEVAMARLCLVDLAKKQAYDQHLRMLAESPKQAAPIPMAVPISTTLETEHALHDLEIALKNRKSKTGQAKSTKKKKTNGKASAQHVGEENVPRKWLWPAVSGGVLLLLTIAGIAWWGWGSPQPAEEIPGKYFLDGELPLSLDPPIEIAANNPVKKSKNSVGLNKSKSEPSKSGTSKSGSKKVGVKNKTKPAENDKNKPGKNPETPAKGPDPASTVTVKSPAGQPSGKTPAAPKTPTKTPSTAKAPPTPPKWPPDSELTFPKSPFKYFKRTYNLPSLTSITKQKINDLYINNSAPLEIELIFKPEWSSSPVTFEIRKPTGDKKRSWVISKRITKNESPVDVANVWFEKYGMYFQWLPAAKLSEETNFLRNGLLRFSISETQTMLLRLRSVKNIQNFAIAEGKYEIEVEADVPWLPASKSLKVELSPFSKSKLESFCPIKLIPNNKSANIYFSQNEYQKFLWLEVKRKIKGSKAKETKLSIEAELKLIDSRKKPRTFDPKMLTDHIQFFDNQYAPQKKKIDAARGKPKEELIKQAKPLTDALAACKRYQGKTIPSLYGQRIDVKLFYEFDERPFVIAKTGEHWKNRQREFNASRNKELANYRLVYDADLKSLSKEVVYDLDFSAAYPSFDRIGYMLELVSKEHGQQAVLVTLEAFTEDAKKIAIPTAQSKAKFQQPLKSMNVYSNVEGITTGTDIATGNIEFWPNAYGAGNGGKVKDADGKRYDFGDQINQKGEYGSMQIHNFGAKQSIFAINHWNEGPKADIGIGNNPTKGKEPDWTFMGNANKYSKKRLRVYVRPK